MLKTKLINLCLLSALLGLSAGDEGFDKLSEDERNSKKVQMPPCGACTTVVNSFLARLSGADFEAIKTKTCSDVTRGEAQCKTNLKGWTEHLRTWWQSENLRSTTSLRQWLCVEVLNVCCPEDHFGPKCQACEKMGQNGKMCSGNGKCKGSGTRKGNGACHCDSGYTGELCNQCSTSHYLSYQDGEKTLCSPCHHACNGECTGAGPKKCLACKVGFIMHADYGCDDIDECRGNPKLCNTDQYCVNLEGGHRCMNCDTACKKCTAEGSENCIECAEGYLRSDPGRVCVKDESGKILTISNVRFFTYGGLCVATAIIFQKSTIMAGVLGLFIAMYISFSEYYLVNMNGELQPVVS
jgi:hypothetical protein